MIESFGDEALPLWFKSHWDTTQVLMWHMGLRVTYGIIFALTGPNINGKEWCGKV